MRLVYKKFSDDTYKIYTTDEWGKNERVFEGDIPPDDRKIRRCSVFIELSCDDELAHVAKDGLDRMIKNLKNVKKMKKVKKEKVRYGNSHNGKTKD